MKKLFSVLLLLNILSACISNIHSEWSCPTLKGGKGSCISISEADDTNGKNLNLSKNDTNFSFTDSKQFIKIKLITTKLDKLKTSKNNFTDSSKLLFLNHQNKLRTEEKIGRVWFAPFIDSEGNQHAESVVFIVDSEPKWISTR